VASHRMVYQQGDHVCTLYNSKEEQLTAAVEYVIGGFSRGERCLYVCGERTPAQFREALQSHGVDVKAAERRGALMILTKDEAHLKGGSFDPDRMISLLHKAVKDALKAGFQGLCAAGDMCWVNDEASEQKGSSNTKRASTSFTPTTKVWGFANTIATRFRNDSSTTVSARIA
jgi:MEDS: MEthanogen/methylotroph, DcmR Sensory domain